MKQLNLSILGLIFIVGCSPEFLDVKRDKSQAIPVSLEEFDLLLSNSTVLNSVSGHSMISIIAEEFEISKNSYDLINRPEERNAYLFKDEAYIGMEAVDWNYPYQRVLYCNIILEGLEKLNASDRQNEHFPRIKGEALFHRANAFFTVLQQFAAYYGDNDHEQYGIPLILKNEPTVPSVRSTVSESYQQILADLVTASESLPLNSQSFYRPNKVSAYALLSRILLMMGKYDNALTYADMALDKHNDLLVYKTIDSTTTYPFPANGNGNSEIIFYDIAHYAEAMLRDKYKVSETLYDLYQVGDFRKELFFSPIAHEGHYFRGSYTGSGNNFTGLATNELYLIKAECLVRANRVREGMAVLNTLLNSRYDPDLFAPLTVDNKEEALDQIILERRKELLNRGLRWGDVRRLNFLDNRNIVLERSFEGENFRLTPNSLEYILLVPFNVIDNSNVVQSPR